MSDAPIPGLFTLLPLFSPSSPPPLAPLSMYSLVLSLSALSSQFTLWAISSPCSPSHSIVELYLLQFSLGVPQLIQTGSLVIMLPTRLQSLHLDVLASPSSLLRLLTPQANLEIFKDQTLTAVRREQARQRNCVNHGGEWEAK